MPVRGIPTSSMPPAIWEAYWRYWHTPRCGNRDSPWPGRGYGGLTDIAFWGFWFVDVRFGRFRHLEKTLTLSKCVTVPSHGPDGFAGWRWSWYPAASCLE